jgi:hypothetical protein
MDTYPTLKATLAKLTRLMLQPNFAKEPFRPSRSNLGLGDSVLRTKNYLTNFNGQRTTRGVTNLG